MMEPSIKTQISGGQNVKNITSNFFNKTGNHQSKPQLSVLNDVPEEDVNKDQKIVYVNENNNTLYDSQSNFFDKERSSLNTPLTAEPDLTRSIRIRKLLKGKELDKVDNRVLM